MTRRGLAQTNREIYCDNCRGFQPLDDENGPHTDHLNPYPWHDLTCATCHLILATIRIKE